MDRIICDSAGSQRDCKLDLLPLVYRSHQQAEGNTDSNESHAPQQVSIVALIASTSYIARLWF
jgi:hypothetical protein